MRKTTQAGITRILRPSTNSQMNDRRDTCSDWTIDSVDLVLQRFINALCYYENKYSFAPMDGLFCNNIRVFFLSFSILTKLGTRFRTTLFISLLHFVTKHNLLVYSSKMQRTIVSSVYLAGILKRVEIEADRLQSTDEHFNKTKNMYVDFRKLPRGESTRIN